jgi:hypothetical protein
MTVQGPGGISAPGAAPQGGSVQVKVETGDPSVTVKSSAGSTTQPVPPGGGVTVPVPNVPPTSVVAVVVGKGNRRVVHLIEVIAPGP